MSTDVRFIPGLKKFLSQYPSLFLINGDYVHINAYQPAQEIPDGNSSLKYSTVGKRDYASEAVEYFAQKLLQYGEGTDVPIKSLLGHRSQASPEVRHISGQHIKEFRDFLIRYPDDFNVTEETVVLKSYSKWKSTELHFQPNVDIDPEITQNLLDFFAQCINVKGPMLVEQLFQLVSCNLPENMWNHLFNTPNHLTSFLRLFTDSFHIQSNIVTLIQQPKVCQKTTENLTVLKRAVEQQPVVVERAKTPEKDESLSPSSPRRKNKVVASINDRLKNPRLNNRNEAENEKKMEEEKNCINETSDDKPKGVSFRLGKYNSKVKEESNDGRFGNINSDYNGKCVSDTYRL